MTFAAPLTGIEIRRDMRRRWLAGGCPARLCPDTPCPVPCVCPPCRCTACQKVSARARLELVTAPPPPPAQMTLAFELAKEDGRL